MLYDQFGNSNGDQLVFARSAEGHSHIPSDENAIKRYKVGDEVAIAGILKVSSIQPNKNGTVSYSFDRGFALHENIVEQMALKPYEKPAQEEVVKKPAYTGKVIATGATELANSLQNNVAYLRVGHIFEIADGFIVGDRETYGFAINRKTPFESFDDFATHHQLNTWLELKD